MKLAPWATMAMASAGMMSIDRRCKTFDARANGMMRTEGVGTHVLQSSEWSPQMPQRLGSAVNCDGRSASITAPNGAAQQKVLRLAFAVSSVSVNEVDVIEAHGTGTQLGDPTEGVALRTVLGGSARGGMLTFGAAKANCGHSEAPSGLLGVMKLVQLVVERLSPGNAHLRQLNPLLSLTAPFHLPQQPSDGASAGRVGVSSFGFSGTIAHAVLLRPTGVCRELRQLMPLFQRRSSFP